MLKVIEKFAPEGVFNPEDVRILVAAFDQAWAHMERSGVQFGSDYRRELARTTIGKSIIELAKQGERDIGRLRDNALLSYGKK
jgi:hypothetical protein